MYNVWRKTDIYWTDNIIGRDKSVLRNNKNKSGWLTGYITQSFQSLLFVMSVCAFLPPFWPYDLERKDGYYYFYSME